MKYEAVYETRAAACGCGGAGASPVLFEFPSMEAAKEFVRRFSGSSRVAPGSSGSYQVVEVRSGNMEEARRLAKELGGIEAKVHRLPHASATPGGCRPYLKIEKDQPRFLACQKIADRIGPINTARKSFEILREAVGGNVAERFGVLTLDTHLRMRGLWETGAGETDSVQAPRVPTLQAAIVDDAAAAVIYHVHPAASDTPSDADVEVTRMFDRAFQEVGIVLVDHVIVAVGSKAGFYSFADSMPATLPMPKG